jgi:hypothetical protein
MIACSSKFFNRLPRPGRTGGVSPFGVNTSFQAVRSCPLLGRSSPAVNMTVSLSGFLASGQHSPLYCKEYHMQMRVTSCHHRFRDGVVNACCHCAVTD